MARVSVGMPVYNGEKWLGEAIDCMLRQSFIDLEILISDNASTDRSLEIAERYALSDARIRVYRNPVNVGGNRNYSMLVGYARGDYFKWHSANDLCQPTFIEKCIELLDARPDVGLCYPRTKLLADTQEAAKEYEDNTQALDEDPIERFRRVLEHVRLNNAINGLVRMNILRSTALMPAYYSADVVLLAEIALRSRLVELPEFLFFRRFDRESATRLQDPQKVRRHHYPTDRLAMFFQTWQQCCGILSAVCRADLTLRQRIAGFVYVAKRWYWASPRFYADLQEMLEAAVGKGGVLNVDRK